MEPTKKNLEGRLYGRHACLKILEKRPQDIIRAYVLEEALPAYKDLLKYLSQEKLPYHLVSREDLESITKATHHEGICLVVRNKKLPGLKELLETKERSLILCLEEVENPHNLGAIMRSAAHFGVKAILYQAKVPVANSSAAIRTAEGGAESVMSIRVSDWREVLDLSQRSGFISFATSVREGKSLFEVDFPKKVLLFFGREKEGMSSGLMQQMNYLITIPGTREVESLNVSSATTSLLTEWYRQGINHIKLT